MSTTSGRPYTVLRLFVLDERRVLDVDRASSVVHRLGAHRRVEGRLPEWRVHMETADQSLAMETCARDLDELDPDWIQFLDFAVLRVPFVVRRESRL